MQLAMSEQEVLALCASKDVAVSAIEPLPSGGTRLVCRSSSGADIVRQKAKAKIIVDEQAREKHRPATPLW
ncbi:MAG TPA: hypothetical protein VGQ34_03055 [Sphingomicrobium sp.]|jgi:hypothetical protein|nr:hypothetical protein [Sphingomicrobium sp.]